MSLRVVIVGAVALGPKVACRLRRLLPDAAITVVDQDRFISYGGCGIPYYLADEVPDETQLMSTSVHAVRDVRFFRVADAENALTARFAADALAGLKVSAAGLGSDGFGSAEYRAHLVGVMARRAVAACG